MRCSKCLLIGIFIGLCLNLGFSTSSTTSKKTKNKKSQQEGNQSQYYKRWLNEDVSYIISEEERNVFKNLKNDEERESFIEDFWLRRNPDPRSAENSFREEHYRRIIYANEHFTSGIPGWKTDRGRIYITWGPPDNIESHPSGGTYDRPTYEGGGTTSTFPFEKWWYRHIEGIQDDVEIEFVDPSGTGEYRMAMSPDEKDALINTPGAGLTLAEQMGLAEKRDRAYFNPSAWNDPNNPQNMFSRAKDSPFSRMEQYFNLQRPPQIKFDDLKSAVTTRIIYDTLSYDTRIDYIRLSSDKVLVPITIELNNKDLEFKKERSLNRATVNVYGMVSSLTGRILAEWEAPITNEFTDLAFPRGKELPSVYQHIVALPPGQRYKLDLVLKDVNSNGMGTQSVALLVPKYEDSGLQSSSIVLASKITGAPKSSDQLQQFIIGDMKIVPNVRSEFKPGDNLLPYMQIYNMQIDQTNQKPSLDITFIVRNNEKVLVEAKGTAENSEQLFYGPRVVLVGMIPLKTLATGTYKLEIKVLDNIANRTLSTSTPFTIKEAVPEISAVNP
jgi:GWxTD domain-containing protein